MEPEQEQHEEPLAVARSTTEEASDSLDAERVDLEDEALQEEYRRKHLEQLRRFQCPGCGESEIF